jgi:hypothetical protein
VHIARDPERNLHFLAKSIKCLFQERSSESGVVDNTCLFSIAGSSGS